MSTPEAIKSLLSSFLVKSNSAGQSKQLLENSKSSSKESGDGLADTSGKDKSANVSSSSSNILRSHSSFLERLDTFSSLTWFGKPDDLSPLICARSGWQNVDTDMLQCVSCMAFLSGHLPAKTDAEGYETAATKLKQNLFSSHDKFCALAANPCPESFCSVPCHDPAGLLSSFIERVEALKPIQDRLPKLDLCPFEDMGYDEGQGGAYCKRHLMPETDTSPQVVTLAFTGWAYRESKPDILLCEMCRRQVGLWNFVRENVSNLDDLSQENNDKEEADAPPDEDYEPNRKKRKKISVTMKPKFNPLEEHHHWCPWVQHNSVTSAAAAATPPRGQAEKNEPQLVCIVALKAIAPGLMDNNTGLAHAMKTSPMVEGLRCFRRVIKEWSSPKQQPTQSPS